jgi:SAM-dependent methyltransferase
LTRQSSHAWQTIEAAAHPSALRNAAPIQAVLERLLAEHCPDGGAILEIAAGSGYHACVFARALPGYRWQPTEADTAGRAAVAALVATADLPNLAPPLVLDVMSSPWPVARADAVVCLNMIHISPWPATLALFAGAARVLPAGGLLITYGPYRIGGDFQADSNRLFDESLRGRNPAWGIRDVKDLDVVAHENGFDRILIQPMPANNHTLAFKKRP